MASLQVIREGIAQTIRGTIPGIHVYDTMADATQVPAVIIDVDAKASCDFTGAMGRGMDIWNILVYVLVARGSDVRAAQDQLDQYVTGAGSKSVRQALWSAPEVAPDTDATVTGLERYGGSFDTANTPMVGAILRLVVRTPGRA